MIIQSPIYWIAAAIILGSVAAGFASLFA